ncbi:ABC transporter ATP-binding protein [Cryptosporangium aurantiacum]|uniref:ABC-2 type transport system ATP-binding protein n=1 Tax=Cryptosporangium aurantiacum TaxID=134849 RepID=A0A1M7HNZ3_9ACTN|nr:ATP-binding cassette domain-containing protein [Cryptosporangium aurantiacum]SHM29837.1 ABC-2 type transport system ATP-binding protein [Cryptosporangium aurantiacum]
MPEPDRAENPVIRATELTKTYGRGAKAVSALKGISFEVPPGTVFAMLGPNGAGKSTTVKILSTLSRPDSGTAEVAGSDVLRQPAAVRRDIGYVSQRPGFDPMATGRENLMLSARLRGIGRRAAARKAAELLAAFGLEDPADRLTKTWSGGMQRKLDVAMGLVHAPRVLFLDEPTTGLDPEARTQLWATVSALTRTSGLTVVLTTHYLDEADQMADDLLIVDRGQVVAQGDPAALKADLGGDTVQVDLVSTDDAGRAGALLERLPGVVHVRRDGLRLRAQARDAAGVLPDALTALQRAEIPLLGAGLSRASLDDVYLRYAGRAYRASADVEGSEVAA